MERLIHDLCYAIRGLGKHFGFAVVATLSLGLGVGLNTAIFSIIESVLVRPLPFYEPQRLYEIWAVSKDEGPDHIGSSGPEFRDYKEQSRTLEHVASVLPHFTITWTGQGEPRTLQCTAVSSDFFPMLGLKPVLGRFYLPEEYYVDGVQVLVSYRFWKQQLNGDPSAVGRVLNVDGTAQTIIGIVPPLPDLFPDTEIWAKVVPSFHWMQVRGNRFLTVIARLKPGITADAGRAELTAILHRGADESQNTSLQLLPLKEILVGEVRTPLELAMGAAGLVLLICCVNVTYLLLARSSERQTEVAVRLALGASQDRILLQLIVENLVLAFSGGILGILLATIGVRFVANLNIDAIPRRDLVRVDVTVLGFALLVTLLMSVFLAWGPSAMFSKINANSALRTGRSHAGSIGRSRFRVFLVSEVGMTVVLLVAAGLLARSFWAIESVNAGFRPDHLLTAYLRTNDYPAGRRFFPELLRRVSVLPGVREAAVSDCMPTEDSREAMLTFEDRPNDPYNVPTVDACWVSPGFFSAVGASLMEGRSFNLHDDESAPPTVLVNQVRVGWHETRDVAVLAISAADFSGGSNDSGPHRSCGSLRNALPLERRLALRGELLIPLLDDLFDLPGVHVPENDVLTFNLKDLDPQTINIEDSCKPVTPGWGAPFNCEDMQGTQVNFKTIDAKPRIHVESIASGGKTLTCSRKNAEELDDLCKAMPGNTAYCGFSNAKSTKDETQDTLGFTTPEYAKRFAKALRHAVTLCGGNKSTF